MIFLVAQVQLQQKGEIHRSQGTHHLVVLSIRVRPDQGPHTRKAHQAIHLTLDLHFLPNLVLEGLRKGNIDTAFIIRI